jgi:SAM-dependent methyltransferase
MFVAMLTRMLIQEHKFKPIAGNVLALGKQSVTLDVATIKRLFAEADCAINPNLDEQNLMRDTSTRARGSLADVGFMKFFSDSINYKTLDVSTYEGADIIHDLNYPVPDNLVGQFDFIIDGGTFDHLVDIRMAFRNVIRMLKPGGRIFQWNAASNFANLAYVSFSADFFFDFFLINKFSDCRTYFAESDGVTAQNWKLTEFIPDAATQYISFPSPKTVMTIVLAEKGADSTDDRIPIQWQYRDEKLRQEYLSNLAVMRNSLRPSLQGYQLSLKHYRELGWL